MLECRDIHKSFGHGRHRQEVLRGVTFACSPGHNCVLLGPSGSGKTTLLSILGCIISPCRGQLEIHGQQVDHANKSQMVDIRRKYVGYVFQQAHLLPFLNIEENVKAIARNAGMGTQDTARRITNLFDHLGLAHLRRKSPRQVSAGERQRVAIARAIVHRPPIVLADEPTAALDWQNGQLAIRLLTELVQQEQLVLVAVTHDTRLLSFFDRVLRIDYGVLSEQ